MNEAELLSLAAETGDLAKVIALAATVASLDYLDARPVTDAEFQQAGETLSFEKWRIAKGGLSPLMRAARGGHLDCVQELIRYGADVNFADHPAIPPWKRTALMYATQGGHAEVVSDLLKAGADLESKDEHVMGEGGGMTAIHFAVESQQAKIVELLASAGASLNVKNKNGQTPVMLAIHHRNMQLLELLLDLGANPTSGLSEATTQTDDSFLMLLLERGAKLGKNSHTLLLSPCEHGRLSAVKALIDAGATVEPEKPDPSGFHTPLIQAAEKDHAEIVDALLQAGAHLHPRTVKTVKRNSGSKVRTLLKNRGIAC